ncbi:MAG: type I methionyl aminopeptidase [Candidatus Omnitrophica bacterium]|nr:type I methionyl aminopeptidase [Candidatus Omnitrophota bacterium]
MIPLKSEKDLELMRQAGKILARVMQGVQGAVKEGITTVELDGLAGDLIRKANVIPAFKGYKGFPANLCASVNEEIVHGIPGERRLKEGDIVSLDLGINLDGYFSDMAVTVGVGRISSLFKRLLEVTKKSLSEGIKEARVNNHISDISFAVQNYVERNGFSVVRQFVGHGIGKKLHEEPEIPNFGLSHKGEVLKSGMVLAIEPMVNIGSWECVILDNGWTAVTKDGLSSAHFEHTVAVTENGPEILTQ